MVVLMRSRLFWRRSAAAAGIYASVVLGFFGTVIVAHAFSTHELGLYAIVIAATGFFQTMLDLTIEEALVKYGFRFQEREDWGRLRRLFGRALQLKLVGGVVAGLCLLALAPAADALFGDSGLTKPLLIAAALPLVQAPENVGGVALILRGRYDIRAFFLFLSMALRLGAIAIGTRYGLTQTIAAIVVAQVLATAAVLGAGWAAFRRNPRVAAVPIGDERPEIARFVMQSSVATGVVALRSTLSPLLLGVVSSPTEVGYFRVAQTPQQGFAALSAPARLVLLTEQTQAWERGTRDSVFAGVRRYSLGAAVAVAVAVPLLLWKAPDLIRLFFTSKNVGATDALRLIVIAGALAVRLRLDEELSRFDRAAEATDLGARSRDARSHSARRRARRGLGGDRRRGCGPCFHGGVHRFLDRSLPADTARAGEQGNASPSTGGGASAVRVLIVSGIWPPDVGGPASHAPDVAQFLRGRGHEVEVVTTADSPPPARPYPVRAVPRHYRVGVRHVRGAALVRQRAREADVVYTTGMFGRSAAGSTLARKPYVVKLTADPAFERSRRRGIVAGNVDDFQDAGWRPYGCAVAVRARRRAAARRARVHAERVSARARADVGRCSRTCRASSRIRRPSWASSVSGKSFAADSA